MYGGRCAGRTPAATIRTKYVAMREPPTEIADGRRIATFADGCASNNTRTLVPFGHRLEELSQ
eukprot:544411-Prymnesium_polylepis.1